MEGGFLHIARQVCPTWLTNVENLVGLKVKLDDSIEGNLEFVQSVKVVNARIVNWRTELPNEPPPYKDSFILQFPTCLKKLTISGQMPAQWRIHHLLEFPNLSHFVIRGKGMHSNDFTGYPFPETTVGISSEEADSIYLQHDPPVQPHLIVLKQLERLEIIMNEFSYPSVLPLTIRLNEPDRAMDHEHHLQHLYFTVLNNISFILNNVKCPKLSTVQLYVYVKAGNLPPPKINWKNKPLQRFLQNHPNLEQLFLPEFEGKQDNNDTIDLETFPAKLKKMQVHLTRFIGDREEAREQNSDYWLKFLQEQTHLQDLYLSFADLSSVWIEDALTSLSFSSKDTLRYVDILIQSEDTVSLNLEMFAMCHSLTVLKLSGRDNEIILRNIHKLPASLKKLYISMAFVEPPTDPDFLIKYINLEMVIVKTILVADQQQTHVRTLNMIRNLFKLRKLNLLMLTFDAPLNSNRDLISMLSQLDEDIDSPYPVFTVKFNLSYEFEAGWDEDTFDEDTLDIEFINMREPEDYSTWHSRHRNAISVDDEDHRIFIFQTLPYLLDIRPGGRLGGVIGFQGGEDMDDESIIDEDDSDSDDSTSTAAERITDHSQEM